MKKGLLVLAVLLVVGAMAFADDMAKPTVSFSGEFDYGAQVVSNSGGTTIQAWNLNEGTSSWTDINPTVTIGDFSAEFYLRSTDLSTWTIPNAWVSEKLLGGMVDVLAGNMDNSVSGTVNQGFGGLSGGSGLQVVATPISGLSLGVFLPAPVVAATLSNTLSSGYRVGAAYTMEKLVTVDATYQGSGEFDAGVNVLAVPNLTLQVEAKVPTASGSTYTVFDNAAYALGSLTVGVNATQSIATGSFTTTIVPNVSYSMGVPSVGAQVTYNTADSSIAPEAWAKATFNANTWAQLQLDYTTASPATTKVNVEFVHTF